MRIEESQRFPLPRKRIYDYIIDPKTWIDWYAGMMDITDQDQVRWAQPGDQVRFGYRMLGRRIEGQLELDEIQPAQYVRFHATVPAIGTVTQEWFYSDAGETSTDLRIVCETDEPTSFFGRLIDRTVIPNTIRRDLRATSENLRRLFATGIPD